mmetsp:Transcript_962/g.3623  ORF Transcript_962/g.3623 Transcript_962/m.3623 type:complete len:217 (-) Transcript_962:25-675(-)
MEHAQLTVILTKRFAAREADVATGSALLTDSSSTNQRNRASMKRIGRCLTSREGNCPAKTSVSIPNNEADVTSGTLSGVAGLEQHRPCCSCRRVARRERHIATHAISARILRAQRYRAAVRLVALPSNELDHTAFSGQRVTTSNGYNSTRGTTVSRHPSSQHDSTTLPCVRCADQQAYVSALASIRFTRLKRDGAGIASNGAPCASRKIPAHSFGT